MTTTTPGPRHPVAPRIPAQSPVTALHLCADNDVNGNPRRCFVVLDHHGRHVETIDEGYSGEAALYSRYPWFQWHAARLYFDEPAEHTTYPHRVNVPPSEYRRHLRADPNSECENLRRRADRCAAYFTSQRG